VVPWIRATLKLFTRVAIERLLPGVDDLIADVAASSSYADLHRHCLTSQCHLLPCAVCVI